MTFISARELRASLPSVVKQVGKGCRFTVLYRSRPAFEIGPVHDVPANPSDLDDEPFYRTRPLGASSSGDAARRHDEVLYR